VPIDIFDTEKTTPDRVFRYPLYERCVWLVALAVAIVAVVFLRDIQDFLASKGTRGWAVLGVVVFFLLITIWVSLRAAISKVVISPVSLKARAFGQGIQRISWVHIQRVFYKWRPLGHKLVFVGSDGARVTIRSSIQGYDQLLAFIRGNAPENVLDQLEAIFGEEEAPEDEEAAPSGPAAEPPEAEAPEDDAPEVEATEQEPEQEPEPEPAAAADTSAAQPATTEQADAPKSEADAAEAQAGEKKRRKWWWVFLGK